jgi:integrase
MPAGSAKLTARTVKNAKPGRYGDGAGLYLVVAKSGARKWVFRFSFSAKVTETGLGSATVVSLADARDKAFELRRLVRNGMNPVEAKRRQALKRATIPSFGAIADALLASKEREWRNPKHRGQWRDSLVKLAAPLRSRPVGEIDTDAVLSVLAPLWQSKPETASRLRGRIEAVLDAAKAQGLRSGENPAAWRGHLAHLLPKRGRLTRHHSAMDYTKVPDFIAKLRGQGSMAALALEFAILTAARSGEVYGTRWSEIDLAARVWTLPPERTKAGREHRVPLAPRAMAILKNLSGAKTCDYVFASPRGRRPLSHVSMAKVLRRMGIVGPTVHGFRSAFRDWAGNETAAPREVAEAALAHVVGDKTERAYRRSDALKHRRRLMDKWARYCGSKRC